ncbi:DUF6167 family protein [Streptomyces sp. NBC_01803]|uniref:DUF6167 family protein n=1 Tax=Streptomyces sp. NBC_01803 TaxID=2975946 RepID=UPI002DDB2B87|nr:DUF6167 family protein [Streptomyces sp. NBC_01803]WSA47162.1 DUF6167 family protein [Streptomyces sp. NBC_01803]
MIRRAFWFTTGAAAGVWATTKVQRTLRRLTPESLAARAADRAVAAGHRAREFALDVRAGMAQREDELNEALGVGPEEPGHDGRTLPPPARRAQLGRAPDITAAPGHRAAAEYGKEDR